MWTFMSTVVRYNPPANNTKVIFPLKRTNEPELKSKMYNTQTFRYAVTCCPTSISLKASTVRPDSLDIAVPDTLNIFLVYVHRNRERFPFQLKWEIRATSGKCYVCLSVWYNGACRLCNHKTISHTLYHFNFE